MTSKLLFPTFLLGVVMSEWVEITKVVNQNAKKIEFSKISSSTSPSYEDILVRPQRFYEITATTNVTENVNTWSLSTTSNPINSSPDLKDLDNNNKSSYEDRKIIRNQSTTNLKALPRAVYRNVSETDDVANREESNENFSYDNHDFSDESHADEIDSEENEEPDSSENESSGFASVLRHVQENLLNYKEESLTGKISLLKVLRDNLLYEIKTRTTNLWLPTTKNERVQPRGYNEDLYHMDFPSNEGALMTIGFLTFAVFLIKLVLKLIYALKYKQQYYYQATTTTAASVFLKRNERDITQDQLEQSAMIMKYIEEYPLS